MARARIAWNEASQTDERQEIRRAIAQQFLDIIGKGKHMIFSLTSCEANCVKTFELPEFFPRAQFVTTERMPCAYKNIEHPKVTKHFGDISRFIQEQAGNYEFAAAWLDYTNEFSTNLCEIAKFVSTFMADNRPHALAVTFIRTNETTERLTSALEKRLGGGYRITCRKRHTEQQKARNKFQMEFVIFEISLTEQGK